MMIDVLKFFRGKEGYNCAQAILKGFQEKYSVPQKTIDAFKACEGGRAEGGLCGALHAVKFLIKNKDRTSKLENRFSEVTGEIHCKAIRKLNRVPCTGCVQTAARLLSELDSSES